jgi:8-oxo-dGTP pyrophosphatase MutT (NUDIX family)
VVGGSWEPVAKCLALGEPGSEGAPGDVKARRLGSQGPPDSAVLVLLWGAPLRVLIVRKSCAVESPWACDAALPGGRIEEGEGPIEAALREAWEEAWIPPRYVKVLGVLEPEPTRSGSRLIAPVVGGLSGPAEHRPMPPEIDFAGWIPLRMLSEPPSPVHHPKRGVVVGYMLPGGTVLWGATLRILSRLYSLLRHCGAPV